MVKKQTIKEFPRVLTELYNWRISEIPILACKHRRFDVTVEHSCDKGRNQSNERWYKCARKNEEQYCTLQVTGSCQDTLFHLTFSSSRFSRKVYALCQRVDGTTVVCFTLQTCGINYARKRESAGARDRKREDVPRFADTFSWMWPPFARALYKLNGNNDCSINIAPPVTPDPINS